MSNEVSITITIADRPYKMTVDKNDEDTVRNAATAINKKINEFASSYAFKDKQDLLAMIALQNATSLVDDNTSSIEPDDIAKLKRIDALLTDYITTL